MRHAPTISDEGGVRALVGAAAIAGGAALLCALLAPAVVNGDGLGYLKAAPTGIVVPGHLAYLPLLRLLGRATGRIDSLSLLGPARALSVASCALAAALLYAAAWRRLGAVGAAVAGAGCAASFAALQAGSDVETYAPALAALCAIAWCGARRHEGGGRGWSVGTALAVALAALLHVENVLVAPAAALLCAAPRAGEPRRYRLADAALVLVGAGAVVLAAYLAAFRARGDTPTSAVRFVLHASHGFSYPLRWSTPIVALYGMAKTLVYAPYPHQASWARVIGDAALGTAALVALARLALVAHEPAEGSGAGLASGATTDGGRAARAGFSGDLVAQGSPPPQVPGSAAIPDRARAPVASRGFGDVPRRAPVRADAAHPRALVLPVTVELAWLLPYAAVGAAFFASDNERWIFLLPPAWLAAAAAAARHARHLRAAVALVAALVACDVALGLPLAADVSLRERADAVTQALAPGDLVISPGHSWDEYLGFYRPRDLDHYPMIYFCGLLGGGEAMRVELAARAASARARHARLFVARTDEPAGSDGWKELAGFGITPRNVDAWLPAGRRVPVAPGLVRIDPP